MSLLTDRESLAARRALVASDARGDLARLADSLAGELAPLVERGVWIPPEKARLTRRGGWCAVDGGRLEFDPWSPRGHRCPECGRVYEEEEHYRWWIMSYQLWLAERAVHAALLFALRGDPRHLDLARDILSGYADAYLGWPNRDNVLGPTRPFFSTYLESIWLLQLTVALDLLEEAGQGGALSGAVRDRLVEPSRELIASYDEGMSNRQVWNDAALMAAGRLLGDPLAIDGVLEHGSGLLAHLHGGLLADGTWYEGENYHLFAQRGLWYGVELASRAGWTLQGDARSRYRESFATPFATALPDLTFPSRRDSQYAASLRQWRFAELAELGLADHDDERLVGALQRLYAADVRRLDTGRSRSTAEAERNGPASALTRADLGWRSLLFARDALPALDAERVAPRSVLLGSQGYAVIRRDAGRLYVALDYGHGGGGHGHPDRLGLALHDGEARWLDDPGTGSYTDPSLHWYRSTLAHVAPLVDGRSQRRVHGELMAWEDRGGAGWVRARARGIADGADASRTIVVMPDYVLDRLEWESERPIALDLPLHIDGTVDDAAWTPEPLSGGDALEDGFAALSRTERADIASPAWLRAEGPWPARMDVWIDAGSDAEWWRAVAPGPPGRGIRRFHLLRQRGTRGAIDIVWSPRRLVRAVRREGDALLVEHVDGSAHAHRRTDEGWTVELRVGGSRSSVDLGGLVPPRAEGAPAEGGRGEATRAPDAPRTIGRTPIRFELGERHWRGAEDDWRSAGSPSATVTLARERDSLLVRVEVRKRDPHFAPLVEENPLDNEQPDINGDGVQLHLALPGQGAGELREHAWLIVPTTSDDSAALGARVTARRAGGAPIPLEVTAVERSDAGWAVALRLPVGRAGVPADEPIGLDVIVNEMPAARERRRGQLVLGGVAPGERVYLLGDRHPIERLSRFIISR